MKTTTLIKAAAVAFAGMTGAAAAATVPFEIDFSTPNPAFSVVAYDPGSIATPSDCGSPCARLANNQTLGVILNGPGTFSLDSFAFNGRDGEDGAISVSLTYGGTEIDLFTEALKGNTMSTAFPGYTGLTAIYFKNVGGGSARIDDILGDITVPEVPLPAAGFLLAGGLGALGAARKRRKS